MTDRLIIAFGPDIPMKEIAAALWYYGRDELEEIIEQANTDMAGACRRLMEARKEADEAFGDGWQVLETRHPEVPWKIEKQLWDMGLSCGKDGELTYWLVPKGKLARVQRLLEE